MTIIAIKVTMIMSRGDQRRVTKMRRYRSKIAIFATQIITPYRMAPTLNHYSD